MSHGNLPVNGARRCGRVGVGAERRLRELAVRREHGAALEGPRVLRDRRQQRGPAQRRRNLALRDDPLATLGEKKRVSAEIQNIRCIKEQTREDLLFLGN